MCAARNLQRTIRSTIAAAIIAWKNARRATKRKQSARANYKSARGALLDSMKTLMALFVVLGAVAALFAAVVIVGPPKHPRPSNNLPELLIGTSAFRAEIADTGLKQMWGLSNRESLPTGRGMLFLFDRASLHGFWMKDMRFPLDLIWIREGRVIGISENLLPEGSSPQQTYYPSSAVDAVFEINADEAAKAGIKIGDATFLKK